jgi:putative phosphoribosyl transferase
MGLPYQNRAAAGRELAGLLRHLADRGPLVLGLPRGGVPVAFEVAEALSAPLDLLLVRKLGVPGHEELAFGAVATGGARVVNQDVVSRLDISDDVIEEITSRQRAELDRLNRAYRADRPEPNVTDRHVIIVDDGLATGATMRAGIAALRQSRPAAIIAAVPVGPPESVRTLAENADEVVCPVVPESFMAVGQWYVDFEQVSDETVRELLRRNWEDVSKRNRSGVLPGSRG